MKPLDDDDAIEGLLYSYDNKPSVIPQWPESRRMTLVVVIVEHFDTPEEQDAEAYVITELSQADALVDFNVSSGPTCLFFTIPKRRAKVLCDDLTDASWLTED